MSNDPRFTENAADDLAAVMAHHNLNLVVCGEGLIYVVKDGAVLHKGRTVINPEDLAGVK